MTIFYNFLLRSSEFGYVSTMKCKTHFKRGFNCLVFKVCIFNILLNVLPAKGALLFTQIDMPNSSATSVQGIDGNTLVGWNIGSTGQFQGFVSSGSINTIMSGPSDAVSTFAYGISGINIVGDSITSSNLSIAFIFNGTTYTILNNPAGIQTEVYGIDGSNIVGSYVDANKDRHGFLYNGTEYITIDNPSGYITVLESISGFNAVGYYLDSLHLSHSFIYNISTLTFTQLNPPFQSDNPNYSVESFATAISGNNIVGIYRQHSGGEHGFIYDGTDYSTIDFPGTFGATEILGISGTTIVGNFSDGANIHGFSANFLAVPEPTSLILFTSSFIAFFWFRRRILSTIG